MPNIETMMQGIDPQDKAYNTSGLTLYDDRVLVAIKETEHITAGGIMLPESATKRTEMAETTATIISVGRFSYDDMDLEHRPKPGDLVLMDKHAGILCKGPADGKSYRIVAPDNILAKIEVA